MKVRYLISFSTGTEGSEGWSTVKETLARADCANLAPPKPTSILAGYFMARLDAEDPRLSALRAVLSKSPFRWSQQREHLYEDVELRAAPLLVVRVTTSEKNVGRHTAEQFSFSTACPECKSGARQIRPLRVKASALPKKDLICQTLDFEYLVKEPLRHGMASARLSGLELMQVVSSKGEPLPWWQVVSRSELPRMAPETRGILRGRPQDECPCCRRDNWFNSATEPPQIVYHKKDFVDSGVPDVAYTYERFGNSNFENSGYLATGMTIVSPRVYDVFRRVEVPNVQFHPIRIVEVALQS